MSLKNIEKVFIWLLYLILLVFVFRIALESIDSILGFLITCLLFILWFLGIIITQLLSETLKEK